MTVPDGLKPKDLIGVPWMVAKALQAPYYTGRIKNIADRAYLAGLIDGEGTISFVERDRGPEHTPTHDCRVFVTNTNLAILERYQSMTAGRINEHSGGADGRFGSLPCYRWQMGTHDSALMLREIYPFLQMKKKQAALIWTLYTTLRHRNGHARTPDTVVQQRRAIADMVRALNRGEHVDLPSWIEEPTSPEEPGWYLRQDIIWAKPNPMPESVRDRCTKSHEYIFLLSKSPRYYYDAEAIAEPSVKAGRVIHSYNSGAKNRQDVSEVNDRRTRIGIANWSKTVPETRNARDVWSITTRGYSGAHFAVFPPELPERCILSGSKPGDTVIDPFGGSGTTAQVADKHGRHSILIEINPDNKALIDERLAQPSLWFSVAD